jgi:hypothetical protein
MKGLKLNVMLGSSMNIEAYHRIHFSGLIVLKRLNLNKFSLLGIKLHPTL